MSYSHRDQYRGRRVDDDDDEIEHKRRRGGGPLDHEEMERRIQDLIVQVGDACGTSSLESNLENLCNILEQDIDKYRTKIIEIITSCVVYMPHKLAVYSTLVGLLNAKNFNFGGEIVEKLVADLQSNLEAENFSFSLYISIFLCDLGNCRVLSLTSIVEFLEGFVEAAFEENVPQVRTDWFAYCVLHSLPWIGSELKEKKADELDNLLQGCEKYICARRKAHVKLLHVWVSQTPHEQEEYLDSLWEQIKQLRESDWKERLILRHSVAFDAVLQDALQHNLPSFSPPIHQSTSVYPVPWVVFRLFDYADCPDDGPVMPGAHSIERFLVEEELSWIIDQNCLDRKACAEELLRYPKRTMIPLPYCILEVIFGQILRLPDSPFSPLFYGALLIDLCKLQPESMPQVLAQAAELLYQRSDKMQPICLDRYVDWFSYHLSNFAYRWSWDDWNDCLQSDVLNRRQIFAREVLERCKRLSYYEKIRELVPTDFDPIMPPKPEICYTLDDTDDMRHVKARHFTQLFQEKASVEVMLEELRKDDLESFDEDLFSIWLTVMFKLASKSFSHNFAALMRYHKTLKTIADSSDEMQAVLLRTLYNSWRNNHQYIVILCDKFLKAQVIDCGVLVQWVFSEDMQQEIHRQWLWELLNLSLERLCKHVSKMRRDLDELEKRSLMEREQRQDRGDGPGENVGSENALSAKREELDAIIDFQKNLFLDVLHKFSVALTEYVLNSERDGTDFRTDWFNWMTGRFRHVFLKHSRDLWSFNDDLSDKLFSSTSIDPNVVEIYQQFVALRN